MPNLSKDFLTLIEAAELLRVSKHTVQAWVSPSSPNHRPEFARLARHAGKRTIFIENELLAWVSLQRSPSEVVPGAERSPYWLERFIGGRGLLKGEMKPLGPDLPSSTWSQFHGGLLGLDLEPLQAWLTDGSPAPRVLRLIKRADGLVLPMTMVASFIARLRRNPIALSALRDFLLTAQIFELAPMREGVLHRLLDFPTGLGERTMIDTACLLEGQVSAIATWNPRLLACLGLPAVAP